MISSIEYLNHQLWKFGRINKRWPVLIVINSCYYNNISQEFMCVYGYDFTKSMVFQGIPIRRSQDTENFIEIY